VHYGNFGGQCLGWVKGSGSGLFSTCIQRFWRAASMRSYSARPSALCPCRRARGASLTRPPRRREQGSNPGDHATVHYI